MISNIIKIQSGNKELQKILKESESVSNYNGLNQKQSLHLRLLCEETDGMLPNLIDNFSGEFWIEFEKNICKINVVIDVPEINSTKKKELINISKNKKNAAAKGIVGKIRSVIEDFFLNDNYMQACTMTPGVYGLVNEYNTSVNYSYIWELNQYKNSIKQQAEKEAWDELEQSIIASIADDVIVGVKGKQASITIIKKF